MDHSCPSSENVKNEWEHTSTPHMRLLGMERDKFGFTFVDPIAGPTV